MSDYQLQKKGKWNWDLFDFLLKLLSVNVLNLILH